MNHARPLHGALCLLGLAAGCGARTTLVPARNDDGAGGAGGAGTSTTSASSASTAVGATTSSTASTGSGVFCPDLVVGGESALFAKFAGLPRLALTEGSADGALSVLAYGDLSELRLISFAPWSSWPEPLPAPAPPAAAEGGQSFAVHGAPAGRLGAVFREATPDGSLLVATPDMDPSAPGGAVRFPIPVASRALAAHVRDDGAVRRLLAVVEEETFSPEGLPTYATRHAMLTPGTPLQLSEPHGCSSGSQWAQVLEMEDRYRLFTLGAPTSSGCGAAGYATALRAVLLDAAGAPTVLSYVDRGFPIDRVAVAPTPTGGLIVHTAIMNALTPIWLIDWHEATGTFSEPVALSAPQFQGYGPIAATAIGSTVAVAYTENGDASSPFRIGIDLLTDGKPTTHFDLPAAGLVDEIALLGSPYETALLVGYATADEQLRVLRLDCIGAL